MGRWQSLRSSGRGRLRRIDEDSIDGSCGRRDRTDSLAGGRRVFLLNGGWNRRLNRGLKGRLRGRLNGRLDGHLRERLAGANGSWRSPLDGRTLRLLRRVESWRVRVL